MLSYLKKQTCKYNELFLVFCSCFMFGRFEPSHAHTLENGIIYNMFNHSLQNNHFISSQLGYLMIPVKYEPLVPPGVEVARRRSESPRFIRSRSHPDSFGIGVLQSRSESESSGDGWSRSKSIGIDRSRPESELVRVYRSLDVLVIRHFISLSFFVFFIYMPLFRWPTSVHFGQLRLQPIPDDSDEFERFRTIPDDSDYQRFWPTPDNSGRLRTTPNDFDYQRLRLRTTPIPTPYNSGRLRLRTAPTPGDSGSGSKQLRTTPDESGRF